MRKAGFDLGEVMRLSETKLTKKPIVQKSKRDYVSKFSENDLRVRLWNTDIGRVDTNKRTVQVFSGGYHTNTTKDRLNKLLQGTKQGGSITQKNFAWNYVAPSGKKVPFREGMTFRF